MAKTKLYYFKTIIGLLRVNAHSYREANRKRNALVSKGLRNRNQIAAIKEAKKPLPKGQIAQASYYGIKESKIVSGGKCTGK